MEPIVIIVKELKDNKITLTESELKSIVRQAYNEGYYEGKKTNWWGTGTGGIIYTNTNTNPTYLNNTTGDTPDLNNITITCEGHNSLGD